LQENIYEIDVYSDEDDRFTVRLTDAEKSKIGGAGFDTIERTNLDTGLPEEVVWKGHFISRK